MDDCKSVAIELLRVFQFAVLELTAKLQAEGASLSAEDIEKLNYVIGMATVTSSNLESQVINQNAAYFLANTAKIEAFMRDAIEFAGTLNEEGFGLDAMMASAAA